MFRSTAQFVLRFSKQCLSNKRVCVGGPLIAATAVALKADELKKQPLWYQTAVRKLAFAVKYSGRKGYIDDVILLENLREKLLPYSDSTNSAILWRYARVLLEIATWTSSADENRMPTFLEAEKMGKKAVGCDNPMEPSAEAHKWYGIILVKLSELRSDKKLDEAVKQLQKAVEYDADDARSWQYLGIAQYLSGDYKSAVSSHKKAEELQPDFSNENKLWLGKAELALRNKKSACENFLKAKALPPRYRSEDKISLQAKEMLLKRCRMKPHEIPEAVSPF